MHDLSLGPPVEVDRYPDATHRGPCYDGVYGCHRCWNAANDGKGTEFPCDRCGETKLTRVRRSYEEPVMYAHCAECTELIAKAFLAECDETNGHFGDEGDEYCDDPECTNCGAP